MLFGKLNVAYLAFCKWPTVAFTLQSVLNIDIIM